MEVESQLSKTTYVKLVLLVYSRKWYFYLILSCLIIILILQLAFQKSLLPFWGLLIFIILVISISILSVALPSKNKNMYLPVKYVFNDDKVNVVSSISTGEVKWDAFVKWQEIANYYLLYVSNQQFICIPKSSIPEQDVTKFETMLSNKIKK